MVTSMDATSQHNIGRSSLAGSQAPSDDRLSAARRRDEGSAPPLPPPPTGRPGSNLITAAAPARSTVPLPSAQRVSRREALVWLTRLGAGLGAAMVLDPERLLWRPGAKTIFVPAVRVGTNTLITIEWVTREALAVLARQLVLAERVTTWRRQEAPVGGGDLRIRVVSRLSVGAPFSGAAR
jgi:hypothetical protein